MREPLDIDHHWPRPLACAEAAERLAGLIPANQVDAIWDELIAPLYDARRFASEWPRGACKRCYVPHPEHPTSAVSPRAGRHLMRCPKYVGPLTHRHAHSHRMAFGNYRAECTCGKSYEEHDDNGHRNTCPDVGLDWRGPRPESKGQQ
jgi:hypothetical protein